jgi:hypothetical protein
MRGTTGTFAFAGALLLASTAAAAKAAFYLGTWTIVSAEPGPWVSTYYDQDKLNAARRLIGTHVKFGNQSVEGPDIIACAHARYYNGGATAGTMLEGRLVNIPLTEGSPADVANASGDYFRPEKLAERLGFTGFSWKTLSTGCTATDRPIYFGNASTAIFQLGDIVLTMKHD